MRIVIDTNVFVIALIGKSYPKLTDLLSENKFTLLFSNDSYDELIEVVNRPKFKSLFTKERIFKLLELIGTIKIIVNVKSNTNICRDIKDNFLLNLCKDGKANYLITEDLDLLELKDYQSTKIVKYRQFISEVL